MEIDGKTYELTGRTIRKDGGVAIYYNVTEDDVTSTGSFVADNEDSARIREAVYQNDDAAQAICLDCIKNRVSVKKES